MTAPALQSQTASTFASATAHLVSMPATVNAGDLLLLAFHCNASDASTPTITTPTGWTIQSARTDTGTNHSAGILYSKKADGTEGGTTVGVTTSTAQAASAQVLRITGWGGTLATDCVSATPVAQSTTSAPDPPSVSWSWGSLDELIVATASFEDFGVTVTTYPTSYTTGAASTGNGFTVASAVRALTATASPANPGAYALSSTVNSVAFTVAVKQVTSVDYPRTSTVSITHTAALTRVEAETRSATSSIAPAVTLARVGGHPRSLVSSIAHAATLSRLYGAVRAPVSSIAHTAALTRRVTQVRTAVSSIAHTAVLSRVFGAARTLTSSIAHTAAVTFATGAGRTSTSSIAHTATLTYTRVSVRVLTSSIAFTGTLARATAATRTQVSSIAHTATLSRLGARARSAASSITHTAALTRSVALVRLLTSSITHTATLARTAGMVRTLVSSIAHLAVLTYQWVSGNPLIPVYIDLEARDAATIDLDARDAAMFDLEARDAVFIDLVAWDRATIDLEARDAAYVDLEARDG